MTKIGMKIFQWTVEGLCTVQKEVIVIRRMQN